MEEYNRLSRYRQEKIMDCFCADLTATQSAKILGLNRKTINRYYGKFRTAIAIKQEADKAAFVGIVEMDESYFGADRLRGHPPKESGGAARLNNLFAAYLSAMGVFIQRLFST